MRWTPWALTASTVAVLFFALVLALVPIAPELYWDVDPRSEDAALAVTMFGPTAMAWLNTLAVVVSALAIAAHRYAHGELSRRALVLAGVGILAALFHLLFGPAGDMLRCGNWIAAVALAVAALHLAEHERCRRIILAAVIAMILPLLLRSAYYVYVEHRETVQHFEQNKDALLRARGWATDSPQARLYERRMTQPDALGAYGLSNVFGSIVAALSVMALAITVGRRRRGGRKAVPFPLVLSAMGLFTLVLTWSKGAMLAIVPAIGLLVMSSLHRKEPGGVRVSIFPFRPVALALVAAAVLAVLVRGALGPPESLEGERSLLFRFHYWQAAGAMLVERPLSMLVGAGPEAFHDAYPRFRNPINPEEVTSAHNVFIDYVAMLGLGGLAWSALLIKWLARGGRRLNEPRVTPPDEMAGHNGKLEIRPADLGVAMALAVPVFGVQYVVAIEPAAQPATLLLWIAGAAGFAAAATVMISGVWMSRRWMDVAAFLGALVLLVHNQIEMTYFHWGSCVLAWLLVAVAGSERQAPLAPPPDLPPDHPDAIDPPIKGVKWKTAWAVPAAFLALALVMLVGYAVPVTKQQSQLRAAAVSLRAGDWGTTLQQLESAAHHVPRDQAAYVNIARLLAEVAERNARSGHLAGAKKSYGLAGETLKKAEKIAPGPQVARARAQIEQRAANVLNEPDRNEVAIEHLRRAVELAPTSVQDYLQLGDLLWKVQRTEEAGQAYHRALELDALLYLDPVRQLTPAERRVVEERVRAAGLEVPPRREQKPEPAA